MYNEERYQIIKRRHQAIVECLKEGMNAKQISEELGVPIRTIQSDIRYIRENQKE